MRKKGIEKYNKTVVLFDKKTNRVIRRIRFKNSKDFESFIDDFRLMRYPGYDWRFVDKK